MTRIGLTEVHPDWVDGWEGDCTNRVHFTHGFTEEVFACRLPIGKLEEGFSATVGTHTIRTVENRDSRLTIRDYSIPEIESLEGTLLNDPNFQHVDCPLTHRFAPGVYYREIFMPKGIFVIGHCHKTEHLNVITEGSATVMFDGVVHQIIAPCVIKSGVNVRKVLYIQEDMRWATIHPTTETDLEKLEALLITKSDAFLTHQSMKELDALKIQIQEEDR